MLSPYEKLKSFRASLLKRRTNREKLVCLLFKKNNIGFFEEKIISPYLIDFYLPSRGLAVEIDGAVHNIGRQKEKDYAKDEYLLSSGIMIQRFRNEDTDEYIMKTILQYPKISDNKKLNINTNINKLNGYFNKGYMSKERYEKNKDMVIEIGKVFFNKEKRRIHYLRSLENK